MTKRIYINNEGSSNKFWSCEYEESGNSVRIEWGRIGRAPEVQTKDFSSFREMLKFVNKKENEKIKKGYALQDEESLQEEKNIANQLGTENKINKMEWVSRSGDILKKISDYDPDKYVYVEVMNSWTKETTRLLMSKDNNYQIRGSVNDSGSEIETDGVVSCIGNSEKFAGVVRRIIKKMADKVREVIKTKEFNSLGVRSLFGMTIDDESCDADVVTQPKVKKSSFKSAAFDDKVIESFISLGNRSLIL